MNRRARITALAVLFMVALSPAVAWAGDKEDSATIAAVDKIVRGDVVQANFGEAKKKLHALLDRCKKTCSSSAVAQVHVALGLVSAQIGQADEAKTSWFDALSSDASVQLPASGVSPAIRQQWEQTQKAWLAANPQPDDSQKSGWVNKGGYELSKAAVAAEVGGNLAECIEKDKAALLQEENLRARLHLALCEAKAGKIIDALRDNSKALETARAKNDAATLKQVQERVTELLPKLAHVTFQIPVGVTDLRIVFDERPIPPERQADNFTIDPGVHRVHAEGILRGARVSYNDEKVEVAEGQTLSVKITLKPAALTGGQLECMVAAKTQEEILQCLPSERKPLVVHLGLDMSGYLDTTAVRVLTPAIRASVASPTAGWNVGASYLVDVVTAASPDIVSTASRRFADTRHAATATGGYQPGRFGGQIYGSYSSEHDYISRTVGATVNGEFLDKQLTPQLGFAHTWDTIGRAGTDYDVFSHSLTVEEISAGATIIMSPVSLVVLGATAALENGDQSKTYRYIPFFEPGVSVPAGASADTVNRARLPAKALEQLPLDRQRFSLGGRYVLRARATSTLRIEERVYDDTWGIKASSTDARYFMDLSPRLRIWPHGRFHVQSGTSFYKRVYGATLNSDGSATVPQFRTSDRELSPMFGVTVGGGVRIALTNPGSKFQLAVVSTADGLFNYYLNALYLRTRLAGYGTIGLEADFEMTSRPILAVVISGTLFLSCADPVLSDAVNALGNETSGIEKGEFHRAGQPCVTCHQEGGPASSSPFTVAGTVFAQPMRQIGVESAEVRMTDADGTKHTAKTNCVGNFFVKPDEWQPKFPILVEVAKDNARRSMRSAIGREASCAGCHSIDIEPADPLSQVGHVYLFATDEPGSPDGAKDCKVDPKRAGTP